MVMSVTIWHNPRCSKSRQTLALLQDNGVTPEIRLYLNVPPTEQELLDVQAMLGGPVLGFTRTGEKTFRELGLTKTSGDADLLAALVAHPILIERPIVIANGQARIGRPPENVLDLL